MKMLQFMEKRWDFKFQDWEDLTKEVVLNLDFVE